MIIKDSKIIRISHLIEYLASFTENDKPNKSEKIKAIKLAMKDNLITEDEAIELVIEYC